MKDFPEFMKKPANRIGKESQYTEGIEGYVFNGADGSQMAFWTCYENRVSKEHTHEYDEYLVVVSGNPNTPILKTWTKKTRLALHPF